MPKKKTSKPSKKAIKDYSETTWTPKETILMITMSGLLAVMLLWLLLGWRLGDLGVLNQTTIPDLGITLMHTYHFLAVPEIYFIGEALLLVVMLIAFVWYINVFYELHAWDLLIEEP